MTICPICYHELNSLLYPDYLLCPDCRVAVRVSGTLAKEPNRRNAYNKEWVVVHSNNPIAHDIANYTAQVVSKIIPVEANVIDIGCGSGLLVDKLSRMGYQASGLDWSEPAIQFAQERHQGEYLLANVEQGLSIGATFDCVVASHILEHLENPHGFLQSVKGILEPEGYLVVVVPNLDWWDPKSMYRSVSSIFDAEHAVGYSPARLRKVLEANGYDVVRILTRTHRLAILTAALITAYHWMGSGKVSVEQGMTQKAYSRITDNPVVSGVLSMAMKPLNRMSERGLRGMELIAIAKKRSQCPLCGLPSLLGHPHEECMDYEAYVADNPQVSRLCNRYDKKDVQ